MMIQENVSLKPYNTFGIDVNARRFVSVTSVDELKNVIEQSRHEPLFIMGGGSNMLLTRDVDALVIQINLRGMEVLKQTDDSVWVEVQAGESWHEFVLYAISNDWGGIENMSLIPGNVGTAPIQNIGAYGREIKDTFVSCKALHLKALELHEFTNEACKFGYRESIFKQSVKGEYIIVSVVFKLTRRNHVINTAYGDIQAELAAQGVTKPTIADVSRAVIAIRQSKLPDPKVLGNSGSFFKNPVIPASQFDELKLRFPDIKSFPVSETEVKVPAGWLIEKAGLKGK
ncbi:MAG TPA: UDP-N-acetylmuramate dehydrogenase, partial [Flavobacterium sp.]|nr:UDP-N-acetylmuramate dehydrogenase [Flavobacterium sp.]